jgi:hypothetical protein
MHYFGYVESVTLMRYYCGYVEVIYDFRFQVIFRVGLGLLVVPWFVPISCSQYPVCLRYTS